MTREEIPGQISRDLAIMTDRAIKKGVRFVQKQDSAWWRLAGRIHRLFSRTDRFMTGTLTTLGKTIALPTEWKEWQPIDKVKLLVHELVHVKQFERYGIFPFLLGWFLFPFPLGLAYFRYRLERVALVRGYEAFLVYWTWGSSEQQRTETRAKVVDDIVERLCGPRNLWSWPFRKSVRKWVEENL